MAISLVERANLYRNRKCVEGGHKVVTESLWGSYKHRKASFGGTFAMEGLCVIFTYEGPFTHNYLSGFGCGWAQFQSHFKNLKFTL